MEEKKEMRERKGRKLRAKELIEREREIDSYPAFLLFLSMMLLFLFLYPLFSSFRRSSAILLRLNPMTVRRQTAHFGVCCRCCSPASSRKKERTQVKRRGTGQDLISRELDATYVLPDKPCEKSELKIS
jgi:hypothetical protein